MFFSNHLAKVAAEEFFINFDCPKGRLQIEIKGNGKKTGKWYFKVQQSIFDKIQCLDS